MADYARFYGAEARPNYENETVFQEMDAEERMHQRLQELRMEGASAAANPIPVEHNVPASAQDSALYQMFPTAAYKPLVRPTAALTPGHSRMTTAPPGLAVQAQPTPQFDDPHQYQPFGQARFSASAHPYPSNPASITALELEISRLRELINQAEARSLSETQTNLNLMRGLEHSLNENYILKHSKRELESRVSDLHATASTLHGTNQNLQDVISQMQAQLTREKARTGEFIHMVNVERGEVARLQAALAQRDADIRYYQRAAPPAFYGRGV